MYTKQIRWSGQAMVLACDGNCAKAWGINGRPRLCLDPGDPDDYAWLADDELGTAPQDPGVYEGGQAKPAGPGDMNKWCSRECERSTLVSPGAPLALRAFSVRIFNQPGKHQVSHVQPA